MAEVIKIKMVLNPYACCENELVYIKNIVLAKNKV